MGGCQIWQNVDVTSCFRVQILNTKFPLLILAALFSLTLINAYRSYVLRNRIKLTNGNNLELHSSAVRNSAPHIVDEESIPMSNYKDIASIRTDLSRNHFDLTEYEPAELHGTSVVIARGFYEKSRIVIELLLVFGQFFNHLHILTNFKNLKNITELTRESIVANLVLWSVLCINVTLRLTNTNQTVLLLNKYKGNLWNEAFASYLISLCLHVLPFRSTLVQELSSFDVVYYRSQLFISVILFCMLFFSPIRDTLPLTYETEDFSTTSPEPTSSIASLISFSWLDPLIAQAYTTNLKLKDIWSLTYTDYSLNIIKRFNKFKSKRANYKFSAVFILFFTKFFIIQWVWALLSAVSTFVPTILLLRLLKYIDNPSSDSQSMAWLYLLCMFTAKVVVSICQGQIDYFGRKASVKIRSIIISEIFIKALKKRIYADNSMSITENDDSEELIESQANNGSIINLMTADAAKVAEMFSYVHAFIDVVVMSTIAITLLYRLLGTAAFIGTAMILLFLPVNYFLTRFMAKLQEKSLAYSDNRIQKLTEFFQAIKLIKCFAWEDKITDQINEVRDQEIDKLRTNAVAWSLNAIVWYASPTIVTSVAFAYFIFVQNKILTAPVAFTALSLFSLLKAPLDQLSNTINFIAQSKVSLNRIQCFLREDEIDKYSQLTVDNAGKKLAFENANISWNASSADSFKLKNIDIDFKIGQLNVIIGSTGSGKSSLLLALLGELQIQSGRIIVPTLESRDELLADENGMTNSFAYCSQTAWIINDTIKNNILFNSKYEETRYHEVLKACSLTADLNILRNGDSTIVGDKGSNLSGGQRQRVSLARALYSKSKHVILDDCLSAVDTQSALHIYQNCITGSLIKGRTCILVSHNVSLTVKSAALVVMLENGTVKHQGHPQELIDSGVLIVKDFTDNEGPEENKAFIFEKTETGFNINNDLVTTPTDAANNMNSNSMAEEECENNTMEAETSGEGSISLKDYTWYFEMFGGTKIVIAVILLYLTAQSIYIGQAWWIRYWLIKNENDSISKKSIGSQVNALQASSSYYLLIYFAIGGIQAVLLGIKLIFTYLAGIEASKNIFRRVLHSILHSKLSFHEKTPIGRIMNRFTKDIQALDSEMAPFMDGTFGCTIQVATSLIIIILVTPKFVFVALFVFMASFVIAYFYLQCSRALKRHESTSRSPLYQHFNESLNGVTTIRAFGDEKRFIYRLLQNIDENNKPFFYVWAINRWLSFRIDLLGAITFFSAGIFILLNIENIDAGKAGISLTYSITFTEFCIWMVKFYSTVELNMNSVERLREYMDIEQESANEVDIELPAVWPQNGEIKFENYNFRYAPDQPSALKNLNFTIESRSKIGVVGKTGSGKSTMVNALFRFSDADSGSISIDDIDISAINLKKLRTSLTIIPQDPTLFTGTIKSNIDPNGDYPDEMIYEALIRVNLVTKNEVLNYLNNNGNDNDSKKNHFLDLKSNIVEGGSNLSQGQRQLICLARSLLHCAKIVFLDEATASIDYESDAKIQETIRSEFSDYTIITVAHRLKSIIDYDKILVLEAGLVMEFDHPYNLLKDKNSSFYKMCENSGELDTLIDLARKSISN